MKWQPAFGTVLKRWRELPPRLTREEIAEEIGCHVKTVARWERGRQMPHDRTLLKAIAAVRAEPEEFLQEVTSLVAQKLRQDQHTQGATHHPPPATPGGGEVLEATPDWPLALPANSPARSIGAELKQLHYAIDKVFAGLATILTSRDPR